MSRSDIKTHEDFQWTIETDLGDGTWRNLQVSRITGEPYFYTNFDLAMEILKIKEYYNSRNNSFRIVGVNMNPIKEK